MKICISNFILHSSTKDKSATSVKDIIRICNALAMEIAVMSPTRIMAGWTNKKSRWYMKAVEMGAFFRIRQQWQGKWKWHVRSNWNSFSHLQRILKSLSQKHSYQHFLQELGYSIIWSEHKHINFSFQEQVAASLQILMPACELLAEPPQQN